MTSQLSPEFPVATFNGFHNFAYLVVLFIEGLAFHLESLDMDHTSIDHFGSYRGIPWPLSPLV